MIRDVLISVFSTAQRQAVATLAACASLSVLVYAFLFVPSANLLAWYTHPDYDLLAMMKNDPTVHGRLIVGFLLLAILYVAGWKAAQKIEFPTRQAWIIVLAGAGIAALVLLYLYPFDAADIFDNIMHGRIQGIYNGNPFQSLPSQYSNDPFYGYTAWRYAPSAYGPGWEVLAGIAARLAGNGIVGNVLIFKFLPGIFMIGAVGIVAMLLNRAAPERALAGVWIMAWNPIALYETFGNGHNDIAMGFWIIAAAWMMYEKGYTRAVLFLLAGGLFKYLSILLIPIVGVIALARLQTWRERLGYIVVTTASSIAILAFFFAPFWEGPQTLTLDRRSHMFTTSLSSIFYQFARMRVGDNIAAVWVTSIAVALTVIFVLWQAWRAFRMVYGRAERFNPHPDWIVFTRISLYVLLFYLLVTCLWFQQWYVVWLVGLAALLPAGMAQSLALWVIFTAGLEKPLVFGPLVFTKQPPDPIQWLELRLSAGSLFLSWLGAWWAMWKARPRASDQWSVVSDQKKHDLG